MVVSGNILITIKFGISSLLKYIENKHSRFVADFSPDSVRYKIQILSFVYIYVFPDLTPRDFSIIYVLNIETVKHDPNVGTRYNTPKQLSDKSESSAIIIAC